MSKQELRLECLKLAASRIADMQLAMLNAETLFAWCEKSGAEDEKQPLKGGPRKPDNTPILP